MIGSLYRQILYPAWHWLKRDGVNRVRHELNHIQWLPIDEITTLQRRKLLALLAFASDQVPYYRSLFQSVGLRADEDFSETQFSQIPLLTKDRIRDAGDTIVSNHLVGNKLIANSTSGSTGEALRFYSDSRSLPYRQASELRSNSFTGWQLGEKTARLWGSPIDQRRSEKLRGKMHGWITRDRFLSSFDLSESQLNQYVNMMRQFKPKLLIGYPGPLEQMALHCVKHGMQIPSVKSVISSAETLSNPQRKIIEEAFGAPVYERYGCREVGEIASECDQHSGLHVSSDRLVVEIVDERGESCSTGQEGRIVITDLHNFGMPFIRYDIGDLGTWSDVSKCKCGRGLPMVSRVSGRTLDVICTSDGRRVGGTFWTLLLRSQPGLRQFQVIQGKLTGVTIRYVRDNDFRSEVLLYFEKNIKGKLGEQFEVEFQEKDSIALSPSGKQKIIISHIS